MGSLPAPAKGRAKDVGGAFRALLKRTALRVAAGTRSAATLAMQKQHARYLIERVGRDTPIADLTSRRIAQLLEKEGRGRRWQLSGNTLRKRASTLSQALELARGRAPKLPEIPYDYRPQLGFLKDLNEYERLRDALTPAQRLWLAVAVWTGQRRSDVERMVREDFDPSVPYVVVRSTKTRRFAGVRIHAAGELVRELGTWWETLPPGAKLVPAWPHANSSLRRACARIGLPTLTTKAFRHTFFTWYVAGNGFTAEMLEIGGWSSMMMPTRVYAHALPVRFRSQIDRTFALAKSLRRGPRKNLASAKTGTQGASDGPKRIGVGGARTPPTPDTRPERHISRDRWDRKSPSTPSQASGELVGPAGLEPAASGLKVREPSPVLLASSLVGQPTERHPCQQPQGPLK